MNMDDLVVRLKELVGLCQNSIGEGVDSFMLTLSTVILAVTTIFLAVIAHRGQKILRAQVMPVIAFAYDGTRWTFKNVGSGPALNLLIAHRNRQGEIDYPFRRFNPLAPGDCVRIEWEKEPNIFIAKYEDVHGVIYTAECGRSINKIERKNRYPNIEKGGKVLQFWQLIRDNDVSPCPPQMDVDTDEKEVSTTASPNVY